MDLKKRIASRVQARALYTYAAQTDKRKRSAQAHRAESRERSESRVQRENITRKNARNAQANKNKATHARPSPSRTAQPREPQVPHTTHATPQSVHTRALHTPRAAPLDLNSRAHLAPRDLDASRALQSTTNDERCRYSDAPTAASSAGPARAVPSPWERHSGAPGRVSTL